MEPRDFRAVAKRVTSALGAIETALDIKGRRANGRVQAQIKT